MNAEDPRSTATDETTTHPSTDHGSTGGQGAAGGDTPGAAPPQRRLVRLPKDSPGAGVASGLGAYFGVDPVLFRLGFIVLVFAGGAGLILYLACWIAMPEGSAEDFGGAPPAPPERTSQWLAIGLAVIVGVLLLSVVPTGAPWGFWGGPFLWAVALIVLGVLLFRWDADRRERGAPRAGTGGAPPPPTGYAAGYAAGHAPPRSPTAGGGPTPPAGSSAPPAYTPPPPAGPPAPPAYTPPPPAGPPAPPAYTPPPPAPTEPPSILGRVATGAGLLVLGVAALLDNVGLLDLAAYHYVALALTVTGVALLVGAWWGRARGFIAVGLLLVPLLVVTSAFAGYTRGAEVGQRFYQPTTVAELADEYGLVAGELRLDLTELAVEPGESVSVDVGVFAGDVLVVVPDDVNVTATGRATAGELQLFDLTTAGLGVSRARAVEAEPNAPSLSIDARATFGRIQVVRPGDRLRVPQPGPPAAILPQERISR